MKYSFKPATHKIQSINLTINMECNLNCRMCEIKKYIKHKKYKIADCYVYNLLSQYKSYNPEGIVQFDTGELFANKKFVYPFLLHCKKIGLKVGIVTNGTLVAEEDLEMLNGNLGYFIVSLDSHLKKVHDFIRGKGTYDEVIRLLDLLNRKAINFSVNTVVSKLNIDHLFEFYLFLNANDYFARHDLNLLTKSYFASAKKTGKFYKTYSFDSNDDKNHAIDMLNEYLYYTDGYKTSYLPQVHGCFVDLIKSKKNGHLKEPLCNVFKRKLIIDFNGDIRLCYLPTYPPIANITDEDLDLKKIWESENTQKIRGKMELCIKQCGKELCNNKRLPFNRV